MKITRNDSRLRQILTGALVVAIVTVLSSQVTLRTDKVLAQQTVHAVALVMDGSGSIDPNDFAIQKDGIVLALQDRQMVARDGSVAVAVVQYAGSTARVEVQYRVIVSDVDISQIVAQVNSIVQIGGSTNPGDGINRAMEQFLTNATPDDETVICLSTDGLPNSGANVATALANAQVAAVPLDTFSVTAIEDPPNYYASDFQAFYGPLVFGGGAITVVENSIAFANVVGATCFSSDPVELVGLEAIQTIQDWTDSVQMIENKPTYVRAHFEPVQSSSTKVVARLHGRRGGNSLPGSPLTSINSGGFINATPNVASRRDQFDQSLNFRLPSSWLSGTVELEIERLGGNMDCQDAADVSNDCKVEVTFNHVDEPEVRFVAVSWADSGGATHTPSNGNLSELAARFRAIYPISGLDWETSSLTYSGALPVDLATLNNQLESMRFWDVCWSIFGCDTLYYGVLRDAPVGGLANGIPGTVAAGNMPEPFEYGRNRHAHEIAHDLGTRHAPYCGAEDPSAPPFPYTTTVGGITVATIGPMNLGEDLLIYGFDNHRQQVVDPTDNFELMSYCGRDTNTWRWISKFTYDALVDEINDRFVVQNPPAIPQDAQSVTYMVIRGFVDLENGTASFLPAGVIDSTVFPPTPPTGEYNLLLKDSAGALVQQIPFQTSDIVTDWPSPDPHIGTFMIPFAADSNIVEANVDFGGNLIGSTFASENLPTVEVVYPNGGEVLTDPVITLEWNGNDLDGDSLTYLVQYSADNGATWQTLVADWPADTYNVSLGSLAGTDEGLIQVMVSDGFHATTDTSDETFSVANHAPDVTIFSPNDNSQYIGVQSVFFDGAAIDLEDGQLTGSSLIWTSNIDGFLGDGESLVLNASTLSEGEHLITLTAVDSGNASDSASARILIYRLPPQATLACNSAPENFETSVPPSGWTVVNNVLNGPNWTTIAGCGELRNYTNGTGEAACTHVGTYGEYAWDTELRTPPFSLVDLSEAWVTYQANYQSWSGVDYLDLDVSTDGGTTWTNLRRWNDDHGAFQNTPGEYVWTNLAAYAGQPNVMLRWHYYNPLPQAPGWYAQIDDVRLGCTPLPPTAVTLSDLDASGSQSPLSVPMATLPMTAVPAAAGLALAAAAWMRRKR